MTLCCLVRGRNSLGWKVVHASIVEVLLAYQSKGAVRLELLVTMPDHLHLIVRVNPAEGIREPIRCLKRFLARKHGVAWQRGFTEHQIRSGKLLVRMAEYARTNPVRAGLVRQADDWPYRWPAPPGDGNG